MSRRVLVTNWVGWRNTSPNVYLLEAIRAKLQPLRPDLTFDIYVLKNLKDLRSHTTTHSLVVLVYEYWKYRYAWNKCLSSSIIR